MSDWDSTAHVTRFEIARVLSYLPALEAMRRSADDAPPTRRGMDAVVDPEPEVVKRFRQDLYDSGLILYDFDWIQWEREHRVCSDVDAISRADLETLRKVLTAHVRADRYFAGHLADVCQRGIIPAAVRRMAAVTRRAVSLARREAKRSQHRHRTLRLLDGDSSAPARAG
jgi:hypothetical protein